MKETIKLDVSQPIWSRFFYVAPLVLIGTKDENGQVDFAPKHMAMPMGWDNFYGFVCTPSHMTYQNIEQTGVFSVTCVRPTQLLLTSLAATPRCDNDENKAILERLNTFPASQVDAEFLQDGYVFLECQHHQTIEGFGENALITGKVVAAHVSKDALRDSETDDAELINHSPLLAYLHPYRFSEVRQTNQFPRPAGMKR